MLQYFVIITIVIAVKSPKTAYVAIIYTHMQIAIYSHDKLCSLQSPVTDARPKGPD